MARHLKRGMDASAIKAADAKVRETVETILAGKMRPGTQREAKSEFMAPDPGSGATRRPGWPLCGHLIACGLIGEPVPPVMISGGPQKKNS